MSNKKQAEPLIIDPSGSLPRLFLEDIQDDEIEIALGDTAKRHIKTVLRSKVGDKIIVIDKESGISYDATYEQGDTVALQKKRQTSTYQTPLITLACPLLKGDHMDLVCEKCTELGAYNLIFWQAERSVARYKEKDISKKLLRFTRISEEASRQCGRNSLPLISYEENMKSLLSTLSSEAQILYASLEEGAKDLGTNKTPSHCIVGPEGDFSPSELRLLQSSHGTPVSLGPLTLRAETAAIAIAARLSL